MTEKDVGKACDRLAEVLGWEVQRYEQGRATRISEGLPDRRYVHSGRGQRVWVELKSPTGKLATQQYRWLTDELAAGGLATVVHSAASLQHLFTLLARRSSIVEAEARRLCLDWVELTWLRGPREGSGGVGRRETTTPRQASRA